MMKAEKMHAIVAALIGLGIAACALPAQAQTASFTMGSVAFEVPVPKGYCVPVGQAADVAALTAAADKENITNLSLFPCGDKGSAADYYLVKAPKNLIATSITLPELLQSAGAEFDKPEFNAMLASGEINDKTSKAFAELTKQVTTLSGQVRPLGHDETCAYMGGVLTFKSETIDYSRTVSACFTVVANRVTFIYRYSEGDPANVLKMLPVVKAFALSMKGKPAD
jgi:hypothetical protein